MSFTNSDIHPDKYIERIRRYLMREGVITEERNHELFLREGPEAVL